jgi:hypothetical protein
MPECSFPLWRKMSQKKAESVVESREACRSERGRQILIFNERNAKTFRQTGGAQGGFPVGIRT